MKPFCHASLVSADKCNLPLSLDDGWRCRVALIAPGIGRMLMLPPEGLRELRTWSVLNGADPWQGADRLGLFADAAPATLTQDHDNLSLDNGRLRVRVSLAPFGLAWDQSSDGNTWQACCADRPTFAYANATTGALGHWQARDGHDQYFGLGDKTGPLNKAGRRWWQSQLLSQVLEPGFDAGWNDNNEYPIWNDAGQSQAGGQAIPIHRSRPLQALLMTQATTEQQQTHRPHKRIYTVTRAGPLGIQRLAQTWSGDNATSWHTLRWNQRMPMTMALSGMFTTSATTSAALPARCPTPNC